MPFKQIKNSYNAGELSQYMDGRTDLAKYYNGCSKLINALVLPHGGFTKRPGTEYIATAANRANLLPFEFSVGDALVLEFSNLLLRFYKDQAIVNKGVGTEDISALDNPIAHWKLNEISGVTVDDSESVNNGTATVDCSTLHEDGKVGTGCFNLAGQYTVEIPDTDDFTFSTGDANDDPFSIACWAYITQQGGIQVLLSKWRNNNTTREWRFSLTNDRKSQLHLADSSTNIESDRIAQWKLNDDAADQVVDDIVASIPHDGLTETANTTDLTATGKLNACFDFGGADCVIITNDHNELSFGDGATDSAFSIAAWVYNDGNNTTQVILSKMDYTTGAESREWYLKMVNQKIGLSLLDESANAYQTRQIDDAISTGWHFVVATYNGVGGINAADGITIYMDKVAVDQTSSSIGTYVAMENTAAKVVIGALEGADGNYGFYWRDKLDNVVLYNIELTQANVKVLWNDGNGTETTSAVEVSAITDAAISTGWHFLCATYSAPADETTAADGIILYVDGAAVASTATNDANYTAMQNGAEEIRIGSQRNSADSANENFWEDKIDEISVYIDVLTPTEVASLYSTTPYSIVSPYTSAEAFQIHITQSADVMYIAHEDHHPQKLSRLDALNWTLVDVPFTGGPFLPENTTTASLVGFARLGGTARSEYYFPAGATGTLTASGADNEPFNSNMVGALWLVKHTRDVDNDTDTFAKDTNVVPTLTTYASGAIFIKGDATVTFEPIATTKMAQLWRKEGNGNWQTYRSFRAATSFSWTEDADDTMYAMTRSDNTINGTLTAKESINRGIVKITGFTSATVVAVEVVDKVLSDNSTDGAVTTSMWAEGAWSDYRGYPRTVGFHEDRLWWASSTNNPDTLWSSQSGLYENMAFSELGLDDEAVTPIIADNEVSQIQWMMSRKVMAIGAANREYSFSAQNPEDPITPLDKKSIPQTGFSSGEIQPVMLNDSIFFLQRQGKKLGAMKFDSVTENFDVDDATLLAYGILDSVPTNMAVSRSPDSIIWVPRTDGIMPTFTYEPKEDVLGWARQIFGNSAAVETATGYVESAAVIHGSSEDEVWVCVRRVINSSTVYYVEKFKPRDWGGDIEDAFFVDSGLTWDGGSEKVITDITRANPCVVSASAHGFTNGQQVYIDTILTVAEIAIITTYDINSNDKIDLGEYAVAAADNAAGVVSDKLLAVMWDMYGGEVLISTLTSSMNELNDTVYTVANAATNTFSLKDSTDTTAINSTDYNPYTAGATVKRVENVITGLDHLEGKTVTIFADGEVLANETVSSYQITIDEFANKVQVGIPYTMKVRSMRLAVPQAPSALQTKIKRATSVVVRYIRSLLGSAGVEYGGVEYLTDIEAAYSTDSADTDPQNRAIQGGFNEDAYTIIVSDDPVPFTALSAVTEVEI